MLEARALRYAGVPVRFPYVPYRAQNALMHAVATAASRRAHALLESPTGTGKSLALLCAALAWQDDVAARIEAREREREEQKRAAAQVAPPPVSARRAREEEEERAAEEDKDAADKGPAEKSAADAASGSAASGAAPTESPSPKKKKKKKKKREKEKKRSPAKPADADGGAGDGGSDSDFQAPKQFRDVEWQKHAKLKRPRRRPEDEEPENAHLVELFQSFEGERPLDSGSEAERSDGDSDDDEDEGGLPRKVPRIFYATRTHNQVAQIIDELRKTEYRPQMTVLASRREYCVREEVHKLRNRNEVCKGLVKARLCMYSRNAEVLASEPELQGEAWDIEELNTLGRKHHGCPYYASNELYKKARIIFCPYNYILDKTVRESVGIDIKGDVVILDEAHNVESYARESASFSADVVDIRQLFDDLGELIEEGTLGSPNSDLAMAGKDIIRLFENVLKLVDDVVAQGLTQHYEYEHSLHEKEGLYDLLLDNGITRGCIEECRAAIIHIRTFHEDDDEKKGDEKKGDEKKDADDAAAPAPDGNQAKTSGFGFGWDSSTPGDSIGTQGINARPSIAARKRRRAQPVLPGRGEVDGDEDEGVPKSVAHCLAVAHELVTSLEYYSEHHDDFSLVIERRSVDFRVVVKFHLWCLNAAVSFAPISKAARSIIVTSGTLSPLHSFAGELGTSFAVAKSLPHVINVRRQLYVGVAGRGPGNVTFDATFTGSSTFAFQDALGAALHDYCRVIPAGVLVFLPSYRLLDKLRGRWMSSGALAKLTAVKGGVFFEPNRRGPDFERVMADYATYAASPQGAVLFGVCRGKLAEGIDFKDEAARGVIVVGIPFPHKGDLQVLRKRAWNNWVRNEHRRLEMMPGSVWYEIQAYRALNQALGRTIRHRYDYGAIILVDSRFRNPDVLAQLPGWTRDALPTGRASHEELVDGLRKFFGQVHDAVAQVAGVAGSASAVTA